MMMLYYMFVAERLSEWLCITQTSLWLLHRTFSAHHYRFQMPHTLLTLGTHSVINLSKIRITSERILYLRGVDYLSLEPIESWEHSGTVSWGAQASHDWTALSLDRCMLPPRCRYMLGYRRLPGMVSLSRYQVMMWVTHALDDVSDHDCFVWVS